MASQECLEEGRLEALPDGRLLAVAQRGNGRAFALLCDRYWYPLLVFCRRLVGDPQIAEDLVQETLLTAWTRLESCEKWRGWLYVIAHNKCVSHVRSESARTGRMRPVELDGLDAVVERSMASPSSAYLWEQRADARRLLAATKRLPPRQRAVVGRRLAGASFHEIADQLGIPEKLARQAAYDARRQLRVERETASP